MGGSSCEPSRWWSCNSFVYDVTVTPTSLFHFTFRIKIVCLHLCTMKTNFWYFVLPCSCIIFRAICEDFIFETVLETFLDCRKPIATIQTFFPHLFAPFN